MRRFLIFSLSIVMLLLLATSCIGTKKDNDYVVMIGDNKISKTEYMVYLYEQKKSFEEKGGEDIWDVEFDGISAKDVAKQNALNSLLLVKVVLKESKNLNITIAEDEKASIDTDSKSLFDEISVNEHYNIHLTYDDIHRIVEESYLQQKLYEFITNGFEISESDFEKYLQEYYALNKDQYNDVTVDYIYTPLDNEGSTTNYDIISNALTEISNGADFDTVQAKYTTNGKLEPFVLESDIFDKSVESAIYSLGVNQTTPVLQDSHGYYIFKVINISNTTIDNIRESVKANYIKKKKQDIYQSQIDNWQANTHVEKNQAVWDSITID